MHAELLKRVLLVALLLALFAPPAAAYHEPRHEWTERTAYTLQQGELSVGVRQLGVGLFDALTVSTSPGVWAIGAVFGTAVPNLELKLRDWFDGPLALSLSAGFLYLDGSDLIEPVARDEHVEARLVQVNASAAGSLQLSAAWRGSLELAYSELAIAGDSDGAFVAGAAALSSLRLGAVAEWRVSRLVALRMTGLVLLYRKDPEVRVEYEANARTTVDGELRVGEAVRPGAWQLLPAIALSGANVNFLAGVGYGHQWLPVAGLVLADRGVVIDFDFFVRF